MHGIACSAEPFTFFPALSWQISLCLKLKKYPSIQTWRYYFMYTVHTCTVILKIFIKSTPLISDIDYWYIIKTQLKFLYLKSYLLSGIDSSAFCCSFASPTTEYICTVQTHNSTVCCGAGRKDSGVPKIRVHIQKELISDLNHFL